MVFDRASNSLQPSANYEARQSPDIIESQLEFCFKQPLKFGAEYDAHGALRARPDGTTVTLESRYKTAAVKNNKAIEK